MNVDSTKRPKRKKRAGPRKGFPLFRHRNGFWCKKVRGKHRYFGAVANDPDGQAALARWLAERDDLLAGRTPQARREELTIRSLANQFLSAKRHLVDARELTVRTWTDYHHACGRVIAVLGPDRLVAELTPDDFRSLRSAAAKTLGPVALGNLIQRIRVAFRWAYDEGLIDRPIRYGQSFNRPSRKTLRQARQAAGPRMFTAAEIQAMIGKAGAQLRAMICLGINCGFGNSDCATLPRAALHIDTGWIDYPRPKTGVPRRCPLWPETVEALQTALAVRPRPKSRAHAGLVFITKYGEPWAKETADNPVTKTTAKLLDSLKIRRGGRGFYALRHTFQTVGDEARDPIATRHIMGHAESSNDMSAAYRERISDDRLWAVTGYVHDWLFSAEESA